MCASPAGTASVTRGVSTYIDTLVDHKMSQFFNDTVPMRVPTLAPYPDFFSFAIIAVMTSLLAFGVKESSIVNNVLTFLNLGTATAAVVTGAIYGEKIEPAAANSELCPTDPAIPRARVPHVASLAYASHPFSDVNQDAMMFTADKKNWSLPPRPGKDVGGFMPYGIKGVIEGAGMCFFGFVGFDCIATTSEEAKNPKRSIPLAIVLSLAIICATYCSISTVLTLLKPYYELDPAAPFTVAFDSMGLDGIKWVVTIGAIFALTTR